MSDPNNFLSRWSRRKLEPPKEGAETGAPETKPAEAQPGAVETQAPAVPVPAQKQPQEPPFDPASLPPIESITAGTDIRDFLKPGVPLSLSRAALRRAWTSDPAIRDFIEIAENQWDFTNDSIPGFGQLDPTEVPRLLAKLMGADQDSTAPSAARPMAEPLPESASPQEVAEKGEQEVATESECAVTAPAPEQAASVDASEQVASHRNKENDAAQKDEADKNLNYAHIRHGHGRALPT
ncbi:MAG: DUF3306 domain-containing protein [Pseudorhodoplanes sp.]|nr:DUF3306 domain-containing protein [Pseudorhodoplanes sp.]